MADHLAEMMAAEKVAGMAELMADVMVVKMGFSLAALWAEWLEFLMVERMVVNLAVVSEAKKVGVTVAATADWKVDAMVELLAELLVDDSVER